MAPPGFDVQHDSRYHYVPTDWICIIFVVLFGLTTFLHFVEALYFRLWFLFPTAVLAGIGETIGWAARYWSSQNFGMLRTPFLMQISTTIIAPTPFLAAYFIILGRLITELGTEYSRLRPMFCAHSHILYADIVALVVQAVGGGIASSFSQSNATKGGNIMLAGIAIQFFFLCLFVILATEFFVRFVLDRPLRRAQETGGKLTAGSSEQDLGTEKPPHFSETVKANARTRLSTRKRLFIAGMTFSLFFLFVRAIYRLIELSDGWNGVVISTQWYFNVFDGTMVALAMITLNVLHPGFLLLF